MNTHPEKWCIEATTENFAELYPWWRANAGESWKRFSIGFTLMSSHPDGSCYFANCIESCIESHPNYQPITIEQFRQITKPMNTLPTKWYIGVTEENREELDRWRQQVATSHRACELIAGHHTLLSKHFCDGSYYYSSTVREIRNDENYKDYEEITIEQFREITNSTSTQKPMTKSIQISRDLLNEYYEAATGPQKAYLTEHFKLDGTTTDKAIRQLHKMACGTWKPRIKKNHPECFSEDSKYFDFSAYVGERGNCGVVEYDVAKSLGLSNDFIQIRGSGSENKNRSFFLTPEYDWELVQEGSAKVLIPTKKQS